MNTIHKQGLLMTGEQKIELPVGSKMLDVQLQQGLPVVWYLCDPENAKVTKKVFIYGTGHPVRQEADYIGTFQMDGGALVFHAFIA